ncbi:nucleotidyl transferase AbiEii/AbiGii toxin family protein [Rhabdochlamydiaceae symbiont of Dictyostelium giganteum]|uniref:nucleotidyl transferase AbiEii/AbiGii toxin family protein n=1 Tax=Rhabdochlamydiaceae symbiont of Dictyostelium giganteum TaxID=3342349 RepID=UPI00384C6C3E
MTSDLEKSFKAKLRFFAQETHRDPADLWQIITLERFLVRLAQSPYHKQFILKGGVLLSKYISIGRETTDLDFLAQKINNEKYYLTTIFENIANIDLNDGFSFKGIQVKELAHPHMEYSGARASMMAYFGKTRFKVVVDIGFGDIVDPIEYKVPLATSSKGDLFEKYVCLTCYPKEFIFAEKLETIIYRGAFNSRMKDFHDLYSMISSFLFLPSPHLKTIVNRVFKHRKTKFILPLFYRESDLNRMQFFWNDYLTDVHHDHLKYLPKAFSEIIHEINQWLLVNLKS